MAIRLKICMMHYLIRYVMLIAISHMYINIYNLLFIRILLSGIQTC
nr:MAG TPA: hypothetical protein [Caudoviricetes sp.]